MENMERFLKRFIPKTHHFVFYSHGLNRQLACFCSPICMLLRPNLYPIECLFCTKKGIFATKHYAF